MTTENSDSISLARPRTAQRLIGVDLLRAVSILAVLLFHWALCANAAPPSSWIDQATLKLSTYGSYGVTLFFVISGFLIMRNILLREPDIYRLSLRDFYVRRIARIQPLLLASIGFGALALVLTGPSISFRDGDAPFDAVFWISLLSFTFNWARVFHGGLAGGWGLHWDVMWSLAVEEQFYLLLPLTLLCVRNYRRLVYVAFGVVTVSLLSRAAIAWTGVIGWEYISPACFDALAIGVLCAHIAPRIDSRRSTMLMAFGVVLILAGAYVGDFLTLLSFLVIELGAGIFILGAQAAKFGSTPLWRLPAWIGQLSYEMYLLHPAVLYFVAPYMKGWPLTTSWLVFCAVTVGVSHLVHVSFTEPMNAWLKGALLKRKERIGEVSIRTA